MTTKTYVNSRGESRKVRLSPNRLTELTEVAEFLQDMDLSLIEEGLKFPELSNQLPLSSSKVAFASFEYRRWLFLRRKYEFEILPPSKTIDMFWHAHILDTYAYQDMCEKVFGYYLHHNPYFGTGASGKVAMDDAFQKMIDRYKETFGEDPTQPK